MRPRLGPSWDNPVLLHVSTGLSTSGLRSFVWETAKRECSWNLNGSDGMSVPQEPRGSSSSAGSLEFRGMFFVYNVKNSNDWRRRTPYVGS